MNQSTPSTMSLFDAINQRRSIRGFMPTPIPEQTLNDIFSAAGKAPSNCNIQPWKVFLAKGAATSELREKMRAAAETLTPTPDYASPRPFSPEYRTRQIDCAVALYEELGIGREDKEARAHAAMRNFEFFDAPYVLFIGMDAKFGASVALDVGMYAQNLMLAMTAHGIGCCAQGALRQYPQVVRDFFDIDDSINILMGLSFGYEDSSHPANRTRVGREKVTTYLQVRDR